MSGGSPDTPQGGPPPDPCPGASIPLRTGGVIHAHLVPCEVCGRRLFYAWYSGTGHRCGRCRFGPGGP